MTHTNTNIAAKQLISNNIHNIDTGAPPHHANNNKQQITHINR